MGGSHCAVAICKNYASKAKKAQEKIMFFQFPKDPNIRKQWVERCHQTYKFNPETNRICSQHFARKDFEDDIKARLMNTYPRKLKSSAVPSLKLLPESDTLSDIKIRSKTSRKKRALAKKQKETVKNLPVSEASVEEEILETLPSTSQESNVDILQMQCDSANPSLNLLPESTTLSDVQIHSKTSRNRRVLAKKQKDETVMYLLVSENPIEVVETSPSTSQERDFDILKKQYDTIMEENESLKRKLEAAQVETSTLKSRVSELEKKLKIRHISTIRLLSRK